MPVDRQGARSAACTECEGRGMVPATPGQPGDGPEPCPSCSAATPNHRCPECGYEMWVGPLKVTPGIEATFIAFCPVDHYEMVRMDALGELEAEAGAGSKTFEQFVKETPNVLGVIHAEVPDDD